MEGYNKPEITREDMAEAENVFLTMTSDGELYKGPLQVLAGHIRSGNDSALTRGMSVLVFSESNKLEREDMCNGPISHMARAIAAVWLEDYYRDHIAEGGLAA